MQIFFTGIFLLYAIKCILFWVYLWQLKEYRLDRMFVHIKDTQQGRRAIFCFESFALFLLIAVYIAGIFSDVVSQYFPLAAVGVFVVFFLIILSDVFSRKLKRPIFTVKAMGITILSIASVLIGIAIPLADVSIWYVLLALILPLLIALIVFVFAFPTEVYTDVVIQKAKKKRKQLKHLQVIAVSGSYGKSTTKEIIAQILSKKFEVVSTPLSNNTPLGVARTLINRVTQSTDFFVAELGAYKKGEIAQLAGIVNPTISVTTAMSDQHLALYGNMENVYESEMELLRSLPKNSLALLNGNSKHMTEFAKKIKNVNQMWFETGKKGKKIISGHDLHPSSRGIQFEYSYKENSCKFSTPLLGTHVVENILPAIFLAYQFGLSEKQIKHAVATLRPLPKTMEKKQLTSGISVIDDTFNESPESVESAVTYLSLFHKRKILIMSPLIELGQNAQSRHVQLGKLLKHIDIVFLTNKNYLKEIQQGIREAKAHTQLFIGSYTTIADRLRNLLQKTDGVLFEGKEAGIVLQKLL